jgi:hypothetical protein
MKQETNTMTAPPTSAKEDRARAAWLLTPPTSAKEDRARAAWLLARRELMLFGVLGIIAIGLSLLL